MKEIIQKTGKFFRAIGQLFVAEPADKSTIIARKVCGKYRAWKYGPLRICIETAASYFPENYQLDEEVLRAANADGNIYSTKAMLYCLLSHARKIEAPRQPLPIKKSYSYVAWQMINLSKVNIVTTLTKHPRLIEIREETLELSAAKAEILILSSGGDYLEVNHLLSKIDLTHKYVIICSVFEEAFIRDHILYRVDRKIKPNFKSENEYLAFIDEIIREATTIPLKI
ncbi:hypothetical protein I6I97_18715 [Sphingobacterium multivorum]|uniref:hypothetical protein n=1 Tax=Sphingobacterium multivorum TaxID=28454 RepID=UPI00191B26FA|nr:hypothetical protein [Sphingobacterium multivorum]QQT61225.1 hypothetical protein I6I97_18715 [Sphingobacterium multivorum]